MPTQFNKQKALDILYRDLESSTRIQNLTILKRKPKLSFLYVTWKESPIRAYVEIITKNGHMSYRVGLSSWYKNVEFYPPDNYLRGLHVLDFLSGLAWSTHQIP